MSSLKCLPVPTINSHVPKYNNWSNYSKNLSLSGRIQCTDIKSDFIVIDIKTIQNKHQLRHASVYIDT